MRNFCDKEFVIFDVETTGLSPAAGDRVVEVAAIKIKDLQPVDQFHSFIDPQRELSIGAYRVNGITPEMLVGAPQAQQVFPELLDFIDEAYLVGHNVKFDLGFLTNELSLIGMKIPKGTKAIDTVRMARTLLPDIGSYSLLSVALFLGLANNQEHRALADVQLTFEVYRKLLEVALRHDIDDVDMIVKRFGNIN